MRKALLLPAAAVVVGIVAVAWNGLTASAEPEPPALFCCVYETCADVDDYLQVQISGQARSFFEVWPCKS
jgi:hypothetical protein